MFVTIITIHPPTYSHAHSSWAPAELCCLQTNGQLVLGGTSDGDLLVFDMVQGCELARHSKHTDAIRTIVLNPTNQTIITGGDDGVSLMSSCALLLHTEITLCTCPAALAHSLHVSPSSSSSISLAWW